MLRSLTVPFLVLSSLAAAVPAVARETVDLGFGWRFSGCGREETVDLPHDFQFALPWSADAHRGRGFKPMGEGLYQRSFKADPSWKGKRVAVEFDGILCLGEVSLNGKQIAKSDFGYIGFEVPIEKDLRWDGENVLSVKASTGYPGCARWYTGGGLYRGVRLIARDEVSVSRHGVFVTTPQVSDARATVAVQVEVDGWTRRTNDLSVAVAILDPAGRPVGKSSARGPLDARLRRIAVPLPEIQVARPRRWDVDDPQLYTAEVVLKVDGRETDRVRQRFGIRTVEFSPAFGFRLNGRKVFLKSMCNHHDLGALGAAAYPRAIERQFRLMKDFGFNAYRCSHNPYSPEFYDLADELGILLVDELTDKWTACTMGRPMTEEFFPLITEWIRANRNHPSIILWSLGNELQQEEGASGFPSDDFGVTTYRIFKTVAERWDPTRKFTVAMYPAREGGYSRSDGRKRFESDKTPPRLSCVTDVASYNYVGGDFPDYKAKFPHLILFQSETAVVDCLRSYWDVDRETTVGLSYWGAISYWGEAPEWPAKGWPFSFFGHDLRPLPTAGLIRTAFCPDEPQAYLAVNEGVDERLWNDAFVGCRKFSTSWNRKSGEKLEVDAFTNGDEAELLLNGKSLGVRKNDIGNSSERNVLRWKDVVWAPGKVEIVARRKGREIARNALETTGSAVRLEVVDETPGWRADGYDLKFLRINALDAKGRLVQDCAAKVRVSVEGPARLLALDEGDQYTDSLFNETAKKMNKGSLLAIFRATKKAGQVRVSFVADGLEKALYTTSTTR